MIQRQAVSFAAPQVYLRKERNSALSTFTVPFHDFKHGIPGETEVTGLSSGTIARRRWPF